MVSSVHIRENEIEEYFRSRKQGKGIWEANLDPEVTSSPKIAIFIMIFPCVPFSTVLFSTKFKMLYDGVNKVL